MSSNAWADLREERHRLENALEREGNAVLHGGGGDLGGEETDFSYHVEKDGEECTYAVSIVRLPA